MRGNDFDPGPLANVEHRRDGERSTLVFIRDFQHPTAKVWTALTNREQLGRWAPFDADRDLDAIGPAVLTVTDGNHVQEFEIEIRHAEAPRLLEFTWEDDVLRWELEARGNGTRLTLFHTVENPSWVPKTAAGWHLCLAVAERMLDGRPMERIAGEEARKFGWSELHDAYARRLGIDDSVLR